jgi:hypothetical protein
MSKRQAKKEKYPRSHARNREAVLADLQKLAGPLRART